MKKFLIFWNEIFEKTVWYLLFLLYFFDIEPEDIYLWNLRDTQKLTCVHHFDEFFSCLFQVWCPTPLTPCVGEWWWLPVPASNTRVQLTVLFKLSRMKVSCPWWRELVSKIIVYGLTKLFHHFFHEIFLFTFCEVFYKVKVFTRNMKHLTCSWHAFTNFENFFLKNFDVFF